MATQRLGCTLGTEWSCMPLIPLPSRIWRPGGQQHRQLMYMQITPHHCHLEVVKPTMRISTSISVAVYLFLGQQCQPSRLRRRVSDSVLPTTTTKKRKIIAKKPGAVKGL